jgi:hypothetical protein
MIDGIPNPGRQFEERFTLDQGLDPNVLQILIKTGKKNTVQFL